MTSCANARESIENRVGTGCTFHICSTVASYKSCLCMLGSYRSTLPSEPKSIEKKSYLRFAVVVAFEAGVKSLLQCLPRTMPPPVVNVRHCALSRFNNAVVVVVVVVVVALYALESHFVLVLLDHLRVLPFLLLIRVFLLLLIVIFLALFISSSLSYSNCTLLLLGPLLPSSPSSCPPPYPQSPCRLFYFYAVIIMYLVLCVVFLLTSLASSRQSFAILIFPLFLLSSLPPSSLLSSYACFHAPVSILRSSSVRQAGNGCCTCSGTRDEPYDQAAGVGTAKG